MTELHCSVVNIIIFCARFVIIVCIFVIMWLCYVEHDCFHEIWCPAENVYNYNIYHISIYFYSMLYKLILDQTPSTCDNKEYYMCKNNWPFYLVLAVVSSFVCKYNSLLTVVFIVGRLEQHFIYLRTCRLYCIFCLEYLYSFPTKVTKNVIYYSYFIFDN